jgi:hypothetical protein
MRQHRPTGDQAEPDRRGDDYLELSACEQRRPLRGLGFSSRPSAGHRFSFFTISSRMFLVEESKDVLRVLRQVREPRESQQSPLRFFRPFALFFDIGPPHLTTHFSHPHDL